MKQREIEHDGTTWKVDDGPADSESGLQLLKFRGDDGRDFTWEVIADMVDDSHPNVMLIMYLELAMRENADRRSGRDSWTG